MACLFLTESPQDHRLVSDAEKKYLAAQPHMQAATGQTKVSVLSEQVVPVAADMVHSLFRCRSNNCLGSLTNLLVVQ